MRNLIYLSFICLLCCKAPEKETPTTQLVGQQKGVDKVPISSKPVKYKVLRSEPSFCDFLLPENSNIGEIKWVAHNALRRYGNVGMAFWG